MGDPAVVDHPGHPDPAARASARGSSGAATRPTRTRRARDRLPPRRHRAGVRATRREVGQGIAASGVDRGDVFLVTKIGPSDAEPARLKRAAEDSLRALAHRLRRPAAAALAEPDAVPLEHTLQALRELQEAGRIRHAGVSNFPAGMLERALDIVPLLADQVEYHPFLEQDALLELVAERDLTLTAYSPLANGKVAARPDADRDRRAARQERRPGRAALADRAGERHRPCRRRRATSAGRELRRVRLRAQRRRTRADRRPAPLMTLT